MANFPFIHNKVHRDSFSPRGGGASSLPLILFVVFAAFLRSLHHCRAGPDVVHSTSRHCGGITRSGAKPTTLSTVTVGATGHNKSYKGLYTSLNFFFSFTLVFYLLSTPNWRTIICLEILSDKSWP